MEALIYFALWAVFFFLMMRFGCGAHVMGHSRAATSQAAGLERPEARSGDLRWQPPEEVEDPICGRTVRTATAKSSVLNGFIYYFCSSECREAFETRTAALGETSDEPRERLEKSDAKRLCPG